MAFIARRLRSTIFMHRRNYSSILNPDSSTVLTSKEKSRAALSLIKGEKNPEKILEICRAAALTPELHLDRVIFSIAVSKLTESKYFEGIRGYLEELKGRTDLQNERFISHSMILYGQAGMIQNAISTFEGMDKLGIKRSVKSLNALLLSCILAKKHDEVNRIFVDFPKNYGIKPNIDTYNTVIKSFCETGSASSGYSVIAQMDRESVSPNATTFGTLIAGFYKELKFEEVGKVLEMMNARGMKPGLSIHNMRIQSLCKLKRSQEAKALLDGLLSRKWKVNWATYHHLILGFCNEGNFEEAKKLFKKMRNTGCHPNSDCYFTMVYYMCKCGDYDTALQICLESMEKNWVPNFSTMKSLVDGLVTISKVDVAKALVEQMKEKFPKTADLWKETEESLAK